MIEKCDVQVIYCENTEQWTVPDHWLSPVPGDQLVEGIDYVVHWPAYVLREDEQPIIVSAR